MILLTNVSAQNANSKCWKITVSQSGGYAGINKIYTLDEKGNLMRKNKSQENFEKIGEEKTAEIGKLVRELKLPGTKLKTFKGSRIYDGIYTSFVINFDGKEYRIEGTSFDDAQFLNLSKKQKATLEKLKAMLAGLNGFLPESTNNQ